MFWQWLLVALVIALAAAYIARAGWRTWRPNAGGCGGGCGCAASKDRPTATIIAADQLKLRRR